MSIQLEHPISLSDIFDPEYRPNLYTILTTERPEERHTMAWNCVLPTIEAHTRTTFPDSLSNRMGLPTYDWEHIQRNGASALIYLGFPKGLEGHKSLDTALATIIVEYPSKHRSPRSPHQLRIGGILHDSTGTIRTVGMKYHLEPTSAVIDQLDVSISNQDADFKNKGLGSTYFFRGTRIPTWLDQYDDTAGFITTAMTEACVGTRRIVRSFDSTKKGNLHLERNVHTLPYTIQNGKHDTVFRHYAEERSWYGSDIEDWRVTIPRYLQTNKTSTPSTIHLGIA